MCILNVGHSQQDELDRVHEISERAEGAEVGAPVRHHLDRVDGVRPVYGGPMVHPDTGKPLPAFLAHRLDSYPPHSVDICPSHAGGFVALVAISIRTRAVAKQRCVASTRGARIPGRLGEHPFAALSHYRPAYGKAGRTLLDALS